MDIGGGSLELALSVDGLLERLESFPFGALRLTERYLGDRARRGRVRKLRKYVREELRTRLRARQWRGAQLIGSGGTFTSRAAMVLARQEMSTAQNVHGTTVPRSELETSRSLRTCRSTTARRPGSAPAGGHHHRILR